MPTPQKFNCIRPCNLNASELICPILENANKLLSLLRQIAFQLFPIMGLSSNTNPGNTSSPDSVTGECNISTSVSIL